MWHGWTSMFRGIASHLTVGFHGIELLRRTAGDEVEFVTLMWFDSIDAVRAFAGPDHEQAVVPPAARRLLARFDDRSSHFEVRIPGPAHGRAT
jgi:antibiotic biosynthesis monooxygenase (ABM) superfamily enzyme